MRLFTTLTLALCALFISTSLFAQQTTYRGAIIETGQPILISVPEDGITMNLQQQAAWTAWVAAHAQRDTVYIAKAGESKGAGSQGNTTISGSLTVTGAAFLGSGAGTPTYTYGPHYISHDAPAASTTITITKDETEIADAGAPVTLTMPGAPASNMSRRITLINESATYSATDGATVTVSPGSKLDLTWDVTAGQWK